MAPESLKIMEISLICMVLEGGGSATIIENLWNSMDLHGLERRVGGAGVPRILENRWNSLDLLAFERGWGGRMTPESSEIQGILWICMVSEGCGELQNH